MSRSVIATGPEGEALQQVFYFYSVRKDVWFSYYLIRDYLTDRCMVRSAEALRTALQETK